MTYIFGELTAPAIPTGFLRDRCSDLEALNVKHYIVTDNQTSDIHRQFNTGKPSGL